MSTASSLVFALLSPMTYAFMNVLDKYVIAHKVRKPQSYAAIAGFVNFLIGMILIIAVSWEGIAFKDLLFPAITGVMMGANFFFWYLLLNKEDVSNVIGFLHVYPVFIAILSFIILHERISLIGYLGMLITITGAVLLSIRMGKIKLKKIIWMLLLLIFVVTIGEFSVKLATTNIPEFNGIAVTTAVGGFVASMIILHKKTREGVKDEVKNVKWAFFAECFTFLGIATVYLAMAGLPATIVSSLSAAQPLALLGFERIMHRRFGKMTREERVLPRFISIALIVVGVLLLYAAQIFGI